MIEADLTLTRLFAEGASELHVKLELATGSLTALVGPSGSGKTTLLRLLSGLETPQQGRIAVNDVVWLDTSQGINQRPQQRSVGYIFQDAALFPNLTVRENILFVTPRDQQALADQLIDATGLGPFIHQKPTVLSGGQQQRVALARALVRQPTLLLLDEPFAGLDVDAGHTLRQLLLDLHRTWGTTTLLVTHDDTDVQALANRIVRLKQGRVQSDEAYVSQSVLPQVNEQIRNVWFNESEQVWVIETATLQLRSANSEWSNVQPGSSLEVFLKR